MGKIQPGPETDIAPVLHRTAEAINKRGLIILISDLLDDPDELLSGIKHFRHKGHEVIIFHILDPLELTLDFSDRTLFRDMETGEELITEPLHIKKDYQKDMQNFCDYLLTQCRQNRVDYIRLMTNQPLDLALTEYLIKRKKIGG